MSRRLILLLAGVVLIPCFLAWSSSVSAKDHVFWGRVLDAETKKPVEGAVVVFYWYEAWPTVAGQATKLYDVKETLTSQKGEWKIVGPKGRPIDRSQDSHLLFLFLTGGTYIREPEFIVFKPGYCSWPKGLSIDACKEKIKFSGKEEVTEGGNLELPRLQDRTRMTIIRNIPALIMVNGEKEKVPVYFKLVEEEEKGIRR